MAIRNGDMMRKKFSVFLTVVAMCLALGIVQAPVANALPSFLNGRSNFVMGLIVVQPNVSGQAKGFVRLSQIKLDANGPGTVHETYWAWSMDDTVVPVASVPTRPTLGCRPNPPAICDVRTPSSFLNSSSTRTGTYTSFTSSGRNYIKLNWPGGRTETFADFTLPADQFSELRLSTHNHPNTLRSLGFMFGSTQSLTSRVSSAGLVARRATLVPPKSVGQAGVGAGFVNVGNVKQWTRQWTTTAFQAADPNVWFGHYGVARGNNCVTNLDKGAQHSYLCNVGADRRLAWHHMLNTMVAKGSGLCTTYTNCTPAALELAKTFSMPVGEGGHLFPSLQILEDDGDFAGLVGVEASLYGTTAASSFMSLFAGIAPCVNAPSVCNS